jgi:hypothetical protein
LITLTLAAVSTDPPSLIRTSKLTVAPIVLLNLPEARIFNTVPGRKSEFAGTVAVWLNAVSAAVLLIAELAVFCT